MKKISTAIATTILSLLLGACAGAPKTGWTLLDPPTDDKGVVQDGQYLVDVKSADTCSGPMIIDRFLANVKKAQVTSLKRISGANAATGTCGAVVVSVSKSIVPSLVSYLVGMDRNDAIRDSAELDAMSRLEAGLLAKQASDYRVDNTQPAQYTTYKIDDNDVIVGTEVDLGVEVDMGGSCGADICL